MFTYHSRPVPPCCLWVSKESRYLSPLLIGQFAGSTFSEMADNNKEDHVDNEIMDDDDEMEDIEEVNEDEDDEEMAEESEEKKVFLPGDPIAEGEELVFDESAYTMYHQAQTGIVQFYELVSYIVNTHF